MGSSEEEEIAVISTSSSARQGRKSCKNIINICFKKKIIEGDCYINNTTNISNNKNTNDHNINHTINNNNINNINNNNHNISNNINDTNNKIIVELNGIVIKNQNIENKKPITCIKNPVKNVFILKKNLSKKVANQVHWQPIESDIKNIGSAKSNHSIKGMVNRSTTLLSTLCYNNIQSSTNNSSKQQTYLNNNINNIALKGMVLPEGVGSSITTISSNKKNSFTNINNTVTRNNNNNSSCFKNCKQNALLKQRFDRVTLNSYNNNNSNSNNNNNNNINKNSNNNNYNTTATITTTNNNNNNNSTNNNTDSNNIVSNVSSPSSVYTKSVTPSTSEIDEDSLMGVEMEAINSSNDLMHVDASLHIITRLLNDDTPSATSSPNSFPLSYPPPKSASSSSSSSSSSTSGRRSSLKTRTRATRQHKTTNRLTCQLMNSYDTVPYRGGRRKEPPPPSLDAEGWKKWEKDRLKKDNHNIIEKRRRYKINDCIAEIGRLLPPIYDMDVLNKKGSILQTSIDYIRQLQQDQQLYFVMQNKNRQLEDANKHLRSQLETLKLQSSSTNIPLQPLDKTLLFDINNNNNNSNNNNTVKNTNSKTNDCCMTSHKNINRKVDSNVCRVKMEKEIDFYEFENNFHENPIYYINNDNNNDCPNSTLTYYESSNILLNDNCNNHNNRNNNTNNDIFNSNYFSFQGCNDDITHAPVNNSNNNNNNNNIHSNNNNIHTHSNNNNNNLTNNNNTNHTLTGNNSIITQTFSICPDNNTHNRNISFNDLPSELAPSTSNSITFHDFHDNLLTNDSMLDMFTRDFNYPNDEYVGLF